MPKSKEWHAQRLLGIGSSDTPKIFGLSPYTSRLELFWIKTGKLQPDDVDSPDAQRGTMMEPLILDMVKVWHEELYPQWDVGVAPSVPYISEDHEWLRCQVDGMIIHREKGMRIPIEIKCPRSSRYANVVADGLPDEWILQGQHHMAVTGASKCLFAIFNANEWQLHTIWLERSEAIIAAIIQKCGEFWELCQAGIEPDFESGEPVVIPEEMRGGTAIKDDSEELAILVQRYVNIKRIAEVAAEEEKSRREEIRSYIDENHGYGKVKGPAGTVTRKMNDGKKSLDKLKMEADGIDNYEKTGEPYEYFRVTPRKEKK